MLATPTNNPQKSTTTEAPSEPLVHVVEDEPAILTLFRNMGRIRGFDIATYSTKTAFLQSFVVTRPGCVVLDLNLPDGTGIEILEKLAEQGCRMPVIFMSGMAKVSEAVAAFKLGSLDFVEKPFDLDVMIDTIESAIATDMEQRNSSACFEEISRRLARLTPRENEVMELVVQGEPNKAIAARLGLSPKTVEVHRANVMRKSEANSVAELVRMHVTFNAS